MFFVFVIKIYFLICIVFKNFLYVHNSIFSGIKMKITLNFCMLYPYGNMSDSGSIFLEIFCYATQRFFRYNNNFFACKTPIPSWRFVFLYGVCRLPLVKCKLRTMIYYHWFNLFFHRFPVRILKYYNNDNDHLFKLKFSGPTWIHVLLSCSTIPKLGVIYFNTFQSLAGSRATRKIFILTIGTHWTELTHYMQIIIIIIIFSGPFIN
jgi:hypothetical protein